MDVMNVRRCLRARWSLDVALAAVLAAGVASASCSSSSNPGAAPHIALIGPPNGPAQGAVEVRGLPRDELDRLRRASWSREEWERVLRVAVAEDQPAVVGTYTVTADAVRFTPRFPFDAGRRYRVSFDPAHPSADAGSTGEVWRHQPIVAFVARPASTATPSTAVAAIHPSGAVVPENQLRLYLHFTGPMGRGPSLEHVSLLDQDGVPIEDPFLPLDAELWNGDRSRFTLLFDPGRVKRGILPNRRMGRPLRAGRRYTLVVSREWTDAQGQPLMREFRHEFRAGPANDRPVDPSAWTIAPPIGGTRDPLRVTFPAPLDYALLLRALGVARDGGSLDGDIAVDQGETRWAFTPSESWRAGRHTLVALPILEDPSGNRIGRAFEIMDAAAGPETEPVRIPFDVADSPSN
jgi:hypothetical protein